MIKKNVTTTVTIIGAGVAGLAAACALAGAGFDVTLLERKPYVGGRAYSYEHPALHEVIDSQHVLLGCCTNLIHLLAEAGVSDKVRWYNELVFLEQGGRRSTFRPSAMPAPVHFSNAFLRAPMLGFQDKVAIARGMTEFLSPAEQDDDLSLEQWLRRTRQTPLALKHFWEPVVLCTLNDSFANCSLRHSAKVFRELFLKSPAGALLGIPTIPLSELYDAAAWLFQARGGQLRLRSGVQSITPGPNGGWIVQTSDGDVASDCVLLAVPFEQAQPLLGGLPQAASGVIASPDFARFTHSPYTTVHLWFDRQITDLDHAALLDTTIQWIFHKSRIRKYSPDRGSYVELVIAGSKAELKMDRETILWRTMGELITFFPEAKQARLIKSGILKEARATFSVLPGLDSARPKAATGWPGIYLSGDWTATGWPATMEGAARSGYLAAEAIVRDQGGSQRFQQADLAPSGWMKIFG